MSQSALKVYRKPVHEVRIYLGGQTGYSGAFINEGDVRGAVWVFQRANVVRWCPPVRITRTQFLATENYREDGWEIVGIDYPPAPAPDVTALWSFMRGLAEVLQKTFKQRRIIVTDSKWIEVLEDPDMEARHG